MRLYSTASQTAQSGRPPAPRKGMVRMLRKLGVKLSAPIRKAPEPPRTEAENTFETAVSGVRRARAAVVCGERK